MSAPTEIDENSENLDHDLIEDEEELEEIDELDEDDDEDDEEEEFEDDDVEEEEEDEDEESEPSEELSDEERVAEILDQFHARLQEENLKSTRQRDTIVEVFFTIDEHISADELLSEVRREQPRIGYATVYRTLKLLVDLGFAITKDFGDGQTRYDPIHDQDPDHDHIICVKCRKIVEFDDADTVERFKAIVGEYGFKLRRRQLELYCECIDPCDTPRR